MNKRNEPKLKYGKKSYDVISNRKFSRLKNLNIINLLNQKYVGEVNSSYRIKNLAILIGPSTKYLTTNQFLDKIDVNLKKKLD